MQAQKLLVRSEVHLSTATVVLHHLSGATVRGDQHTADLVVLNRFNEVAVAHSSRFLLCVSTAEECWGNHDNRQHQQGRKANVAPSLVQSSPRLDEGMLTESSGITRSAEPQQRS